MLISSPSLNKFYCSPLLYSFYKLKTKSYSTNNSLTSHKYPTDINSHSTDTKLQVVYHKFTTEEAVEIFNKHDKNRMFAINNQSLITSNSLQKVLLPFFGLDISITKSGYRGQYGVTYTHTTVGHKGHVQVHTKTNWYDIGGELGPKEYKDSDQSLRIYAGFNYNESIVNEAMTGWDVTSNLKSFEHFRIDKQTLIEQFQLKENAVEELFEKVITNYETRRAEADIKRKSGYSLTKVDSLNWRHQSYKIYFYLLPVYIQKEIDQPPRILPALNINSAKVFGPNSISPSKAALAYIATTGTVLAGAAAVIGAPLTIPLGTAVMGASAIVGGGGLLTATWAKYRLQGKNYWQENEMARKRSDNEKNYNETIDDKLLALATAPKLSLSSSVTSEINLIETPKTIESVHLKEKVSHPASLHKYMKLLDLEVDEVLTNEKIELAELKAPQKFKGNNRHFIAMLQDCAEAKRELLAYIKKVSSRQNGRE